ncbi:MAG: hypothetical protein CMJ54_06060 [Planctomycetaceae bacterium]|nr:hypothetical protein [Planctomycetaceae bacterium]
MSNSPQENLTSPSDADSDLNLTAGGPTPERLVEDVLRDARSLLGEPVAAATHPEQDVEAASEAAVDEMMDRAGADADPSTNESGSDAGMQAGGIKRGPAARDLGSEGPLVDLFGVPSHVEAASSSPLASSADEKDTGEASVPTETDATNVEAASPAAALEALMESRIAEESEEGRSTSAMLEAPASSVDPGEIAMAEAAERSAVASLDAMGGNPPLRSTAGEVDAVSSGDPLTRVEMDMPRPETSPTDSAPPTSVGPATSEFEGIDEEEVSAPAATSDGRSNSPGALPEVEREPASVDSPSERDSMLPVEGSPTPCPGQTPSGIARIAALPFRLLPSSVHGLVSVAAISLVFWIPVAWTYAILGSEAFTSLLPSATTPAEPDESPEVDPAPVESDQADATSTP